MAEKNLNSRIVHKHDIEVNWSKATNFIPKIGEIIVYDPDENHAAARAKIGDGVKTVIELAFIDDAAKTALFKEIDMVDEKVEALSELIGDTSVQDQIDARINLLEDYIYPNYLINATTLKAHYDVHQVDREFGLFKEYRFEVEKLVNVDDPSIALIEIENQGVLLGYFNSYSSTSADGLTTEQTFIFTSNNPEYNLKDKIYAGFDFKYYDANCNIINITSYTIPCYIRFCEVTDSETILTLDEKLIPDTVARKEDFHKVAKTGSWNDLEDKPDQDDALNIAAETGLIEPVVADDGSIYTDENGYILTLN